MPFPFVKGGGQRRFYEIGKNIASDGWEVDWVSFKAWSGLTKLKTTYIRYIGIKNLPVIYNTYGNRRKFPPIIFAITLIKNISIFKNYDVIWVGQWPLLHIIPSIIASKYYNKKLIIDWWEVWGKKIWVNYSKSIGYLGYVLEKLSIWFSTKSATVFTDSLLEKEKLIKNSYPNTTIHLVPNGISKAEIGDISFPKKTKFDIVSFGRLKNHKRVDLLIEAIKIILKNYNIKYSLAIIGDGPNKKELQTLTNKLGLGDQVTFFGTIPKLTDMYNLIKKCSICCITTQGGGGGNLAILEANACGLPVIIFDYEDGIDSSLIKSGQNGVFVNSLDSYQLGKSIYGLLKDKSLLQKISHSSYQYSTNYNWNNLSEKYKNNFLS